MGTRLPHTEANRHIERRPLNNRDGYRRNDQHNGVHDTKHHGLRRPSTRDRRRYSLDIDIGLQLKAGPRGAGTDGCRQCTGTDRTAQR